MSRKTRSWDGFGPRRQTKALIALAILAVALVIRFLYLPHIQALPTFDHPVMDAEYHDNWAREVAKLDYVPSDTAFYRHRNQKHYEQQP